MITLSVFRLNGLDLIMRKLFAFSKLIFPLICFLMIVCCIIFLLMLTCVWTGAMLRRSTAMPNNYFFPSLDYYHKFPTYKQIKAWSGIMEDECPDEIYHFSVKDFHCCIVRNVCIPADQRCSTSVALDYRSFFGSYSVRVLGLPPKIGVWQSYYTGDFYNAVAKFRDLVQNYLNGVYTLE